MGIILKGLAKHESQAFKSCLDEFPSLDLYDGHVVYSMSAGRWAAISSVLDNLTLAGKGTLYNDAFIDNDERYCTTVYSCISTAINLKYLWPNVADCIAKWNKDPNNAKWASPFDTDDMNTFIMFLRICGGFWLD